VPVTIPPSFDSGTTPVRQSELNQSTLRSGEVNSISLSLFRSARTSESRSSGRPSRNAPAVSPPSPPAFAARASRNGRRSPPVGAYQPLGPRQSQAGSRQSLAPPQFGQFLPRDRQHRLAVERLERHDTIRRLKNSAGRTPSPRRTALRLPAEAERLLLAAQVRRQTTPRCEASSHGRSGP
jgi:hypothetical protein